jgi:hypothetical protein
MASYQSGGRGQKSPEGGLQIEVQWYHYVAGAVLVLGLCAVLLVGVNRQASRVGSVAPRGATPASSQDEGQIPPPKQR